ncbi:hypothetical protein HV824_12845 [Myxococcus sp. AM009]|uniref:DNA methyltransferase n=1 Tax=Myxococcus sp. AM009 TaxID=2745137 RepID=UPI001594F472|nr:DNA methyltransferase [Myxococcus sp. AM009]NVI99002.1 hypothetical protein [Myxococcus sp. AM009]
MKIGAGRGRSHHADVQLNLLSQAGISRSISAIQTTTREKIEVELGIVAAETWPPRYKVHKYWGRKPANVVSKYIEFFSRRGEQVLDPFAGSGVTLVEGARLGRHVLGFDLNPFAARLTSAMLSPPSPRAFEQAAKAVVESATRAVGHLYRTHCDSCGGSATLRSVGYVGQDAREVRYRCDSCAKSGNRSPTPEDERLLKDPVHAPPSAPDADILFGWEMQKLKRRGLRRWRELFTPRNFAAAAHLREAILAERDASCREWLLLTLTASLAQFTRMIADFAGDAGGPSWKINCYWMPEKWQELNPLWYFENRVSKSHDSIVDLVAEGAPFKNGAARIADSRALSLEDNSVDYIFTDPPYGGEGIQYGELSLLWCLWLGEQQALDAEVAYNPYRNLDQAHYAKGLAQVFAECHRVLKPGRWMTVTFANKDPVVWDALMHACRNAGFVLVTAAPMKRSAPSLTETTMHSAPKADLVLNFQKLMEGTRRAPVHSTSYSVEDAVTRIRAAMLRDGLEADTHSLFDRVTVDWFSWFYENGNRPEAVQPTLARVEASLRGRPST